MHEPPHFIQRRYTFISTLLAPYTIPFSLLFIPPILLQEAQNCHIYEEQKSGCELLFRCLPGVTPHARATRLPHIITFEGAFWTFPPPLNFDLETWMCLDRATIPEPARQGCWDLNLTSGEVQGYDKGDDGSGRE